MFHKRSIHPSIILEIKHEAYKRLPPTEPCIVLNVREQTLVGGGRITSKIEMVAFRSRYGMKKKSVSGNEIHMRKVWQ